MRTAVPLVIRRAFILLIFFVLVSCAPKKEAPQKNNTPLPDLGISIMLPPGMEAVSPAEIQAIQEQAADYPAIPPFRDLPLYQFVDPAAQSILLVSELSFEDEADTVRGPVGLMDDYRKSLEAYYGVDSIEAADMISGKFRLLIMRFLYEPGGEQLYLVKVLYYYYPQLYFMLDLYFNAEKTSVEAAEAFEAMFYSVQVEP